MDNRLGMKLSICATAFALVCAGCVEQRVQSRGATGIVLDQGTRLPVNHAQVAVSEYVGEDASPSNVLAHVRKPIAETDSAGSFAIPPKFKRVFTLPIGDYWPPPGLLVVKCAGYKTTVFPVSGVIPTNMISADGRVQHLIQSDGSPSAR